MIHFSVKNPLIANLWMALIVIAGIFAWQSMPQEMFPNFETDKVQIRTVFEGASPVEVEQQITLPIENELDGMADIDILSSTSSEGLSLITIALKTGSDVDDFMREAQNALDQVKDLPNEADESQLSRLKTRFPVISVSLYGDIANTALLDIAEQVKNELLLRPGIASVGVSGNRDWEFWVTVDPMQLAARNISLNQISIALQDNLKDLPGGSIKSLAGDIRLRGVGHSPTIEGIGDISVKTGSDGRFIRIRDVASVELRLEETKTVGRFNGKPSINLTINKTASASTIDIAADVRVYLQQRQLTFPTGVEAGLFNDLSAYVKTRLNTVKSSGFIGLILVLLSLYLLLNFRIAFITALGIPVSFLFAVIVLQQTGQSINMISLFAFLIALGMIVDDAIIVTENIYRHIEEGMEAKQAAVQGTKEVFWPVMASTSTTIVAFLPMFAITGTMGAFIAVIPIVVTGSLLGSLFEAFGILPSHAAEWLKAQRQHSQRALQQRKRWLQKYTSVLRWCLVNRYLVSTISIAILAISLSWASTRIPFVLFGQVSVGQFFINIEAPDTYSIEDTTALSKRLEQQIFETLDENELDTLLTNVGVIFIDFSRVRFGSKYIQLVFNLKKPKPKGFIENWITPITSLNFNMDGIRERDTETIINEIRELLKKQPEIQRLSVLRPQGGPAGADIEIGITGQDINRLRQHAVAIKDFVSTLPGLSDVRQDMDLGKIEYHYQLNHRGKQLGITQQQLANAVRIGFLGLETVHVNWLDKRIPVRLTYNENWRHNSDALNNLPIILNNGQQFILSDIADIKTGRGFNSIQRRDNKRLAIVTAETDDKQMTASEVVTLVKNKFIGLTQPASDYQLLFLGEKKQASESLADIQRATWLSIVLIYFILASLFRSLLDPLIVMFAIPFSAIGVVIGHAIFNYNIQFLSLIGFLALTGIVVNDSLILISFAKRLREQGMERIDAVVEAGRVRIRPILLTSITTFLGISPLIFFATGQTAFLSPMAVSLGFGLLFATVLILLSLPSFYLIADDMRHKVVCWIYKTKKENSDHVS